MRAENAAYMRVWYRKNSDRISAARRERYAADSQHRESITEKNRESHLKHREERVSAMREAYALNPSPYKARAKVYRHAMMTDPGWRGQQHRTKALERSKAHKFAKSRAMPKWASREEILKLYEVARSMTDLTGTEYHVDHIYPLRGKNFSGLHLPWNLQVMPGHENMAKGNRI